MTLAPVIVRELRVSARRPFTYNLRVIGLATLLAVCIWLTFTRALDWSDGGKALALLHRALFVVIWALVPLLTADCISRERREGTLPLLCLTPLRPVGIVLAKGLAHGVTALTLWLTVLPLLTVPFLLGGAGWGEALLSVMINFSSLCLALGAGLLASARAKAFVRAMILAELLSFALCGLFILGTGCAQSVVLRRAFPGRFFTMAFTVETAVELGQAVALDGERVWPDIMALPPRPRRWIVGGQAFVAAAALLALWLMVLCAARTVKRVWREPPPSARVLWLERTFCTPLFFRQWFRRWLRWEMERNPVGWLERRTWSGRLVMWGWLAVVISLLLIILTQFTWVDNAFHEMLYVVGWLMVANLTASAAGSFRRERENRVLELLLVSPLHEWQILGGRVRGLWGQFLPAMALLLGAWLYCGSGLGLAFHLSALLIVASSLLCLPVIGLYYSLACRWFMSAFFWTLVMGFALPGVVAEGAARLGIALLWASSGGLYQAPSQLPNAFLSAAWLLPLFQMIVAYLMALRLHSDLRRRKFPLEGGAR
jgi:ABC-type transport system involved in multi-copper enzyme maturation permease subunit